MKDIDKIKKKIVKETYSKWHGEIKKSDDYDVKEVEPEEKVTSFLPTVDLKMKRKGALHKYI